MDEFTRVGRKPYREDGEESDEEDEDDTTDEDEGVDGLTAGEFELLFLLDARSRNSTRLLARLVSSTPSLILSHSSFFVSLISRTTLHHPRNQLSRLHLARRRSRLRQRL